MDAHTTTHPDYGTGNKTLGIYVFGMISCVILTIISFWAVMASTSAAFGIIFASAIVQFLVQVVCFLRLHIKTEQGQMNVMAFGYTIIILLSIVAGSLWIMWNLNYNMMH